jgi:hypothetical protein
MEPGKMLVLDDSYEHRGTQRQQRVSSHLVDAVLASQLGCSRNDEVLAQALQCKEDDGLRRYNPPPAT